LYILFEYIDIDIDIDIDIMHLYRLISDKIEKVILETEGGGVYIFV
jgi:hypothetical protein